MEINSYLSVAYLLVFLPASVLLYEIMPKKVRPYILLAASIIFFIFISKFLVFYLIFSALSIYVCALLLDKMKENQKQLQARAESREEKKLIKKKGNARQAAVTVVFALLNLGILAMIKYLPFFGENLKALFSLIHLPLNWVVPKFLAPIGISFYTLQAVSYLHDVYKGKIKADRNPARVALFLSFFPIIMEGPICRYSDTAEQLFSGERIYFKNLTFGMQRMIFGLMKKMVIADRVNLIVKNIFRDFETSHYDGGIIAVGAILYTLELYMEFSGTIDVVIGSGEIFGVKIPENFRQPFFAKSISEFWQRWHITLGTWFRDYIFYPVTMSKGMKNLTRSCRKKLGRNYGPLPASIIAFFCVWLCNGLWHGAGWQYIFFGMYHFVLISLGALILPLSNALFQKIGLDKQKLPYRIFAIVRTTILVIIGEMFFNARGMAEGFSMFKTLVCNFSLRSILNGSIFTLGIDRHDIIIVVITLLFVLFVSIVKEKGISPREWLAERPFVLRSAVYIAMILFTVVFGAYGSGYLPIDPIYANF